ncbi:class I SAM-dependent methyltransferase [Ammoniphilus sp. CFH 90114]|uniref:class I SAM-dependent methyltransferase n=1 Tax=Ammoniphilus sp. CFH 90114 TaxID=2493665 RepID=UPI00100F01FD|nr:rRNA adenine N-6-methyltransferase family protein [Ammoniphilus sp. CFH 90114]RXT03716.1 phospholipid methyltransferase [Ammoniphilus sp. CFH 90114]
MMSLAKQRFTFLNKFIESPAQVGSITPSSKFLVNKMFENVSWDKLDTIVELGAGTGVFTNHIFERKKVSTKAVIIEKDTQMRLNLEKSYPSLIFGPDAERLDLLLHKLNIPQVDCIVSGLPFANFPLELRKNIMEAITKSLKPDGLFIAFQYSLQMKSMLKQYFHHVEIGLEVRNLPPAFVYTCKKKKEGRLEWI